MSEPGGTGAAGPPGGATALAPDGAGGASGAVVASLVQQLRHDSVDAALQAVTASAGTEAAYVGVVTPEVFAFGRTRATGSPWPSLADGRLLPLAASLCQVVVSGGPWRAEDVTTDPAYAAAASLSDLGTRAYAGVEVAAAGLPEGVRVTLCALDRQGRLVPDGTRDVLLSLTGVVASRLAEALGTVVLRTEHGWRVSGHDEELDDLTSAMVLADLLAAERGEARRAGRPLRGDDAVDEAERLRVAVGQLEHALAARVVVEQAIGVLSERRRVPPRSAFESLRGVARGTGRRVHDLAREVVGSATDAGQQLPATLARRTGAAVPSPAAVAQALRNRRPDA